MRKQNQYNKADLDFLRMALSDFDDLIEVREHSEILTGEVNSTVYVTWKISGYTRENTKLLNAYLATSTDALRIFAMDIDGENNFQIACKLEKELTAANLTFKVVLLHGHFDE